MYGRSIVKCLNNINGQISWSVCPLQEFLAMSNILGKTAMWVSHSFSEGSSFNWLYPPSLNPCGDL